MKKRIQLSSYQTIKTRRHLVRRIVLAVLAFFVVYFLLTTFVFSTQVLSNASMAPGLRSGDRFIVSSHRIPFLFSGAKQKVFVRRGDIVLIDFSYAQNRNALFYLADNVVRFWTAQRLGLDKAGRRPYIKRVIALPGDTVSMTNYVIRVKPRDNAYSFTEFETSARPYNVTIPQVPALWDESLPFSGNMDPITLGPDQCFVLSDDRNNTNDSRSWGPIPLEVLAGRVVFRYWPLNRLGRP
jgi:signal peptidase I